MRGRSRGAACRPHVSSQGRLDEALRCYAARQAAAARQGAQACTPVGLEAERARGRAGLGHALFTQLCQGRGGFLGRRRRLRLDQGPLTRFAGNLVRGGGAGEVITGATASDCVAAG